MLLEVRDLHAFYGKSHILQGVDLRVDQGEIVSLLGRNGVGRSTACKTIMGLVPPVGEISFKDRRIAGLRPDQIAHLGVGYVPEGRKIFGPLTVLENLKVPQARPGPWDIERVWKLFPRLAERKSQLGRQLSGGEQEMLHFTSPSPGWPSSKSLTGRRLGSSASNISAPSIQTFSGRE